MSYRRLLYIFVLLLLAIFIGQTVLAGNYQKRGLTVSFLDVGQGDSILIDYLGDYQILIDGGPGGNELVSLVSKSLQPTDRKVEIVILTHPDKDHYQGLVELSKKYEIGLFIHNGAEDEAEGYQQFKRMLDDKKIRTEMAMEGSHLLIGKYFKMDFFNPDQFIADKEEKNSESIVTRLDFGKNSFLFMGDAEIETENDIISDKEDIDVEFLKVGHHGSKNATGIEFLKRTTPKYAVISVGQNSYGHPTEETLERLDKSGAEVLRTDVLGTVHVVCEKVKDDCEILK